MTIRLPNLSQGGKGGLPKSEEEKGHGRKDSIRKGNRESAEKSRNEKTIQGGKPLVTSEKLGMPLSAQKLLHSKY